MKYETNVWYGWNGGECPVHPETEVQVQMANETREQVESESPPSAHPAWEWMWDLDDWHSGRVTAFRVIKEHKEPREFWIVCGYAFPTEYEAKECKRVLRNDHYEIIHVKEVLE